MSCRQTSSVPRDSICASARSHPDGSSVSCTGSATPWAANSSGRTAGRHPQLAPTRRADLDRHAEIPDRDVDLQHRCVRGDTHGHLGRDTGVVDRYIDPAPGERGHRGAELVGRAIGHRPRHGEAVDVGRSRGDRSTVCASHVGNRPGRSARRPRRRGPTARPRGRPRRPPTAARPPGPTRSSRRPHRHRTTDRSTGLEGHASLDRYPPRPPAPPARRRMRPPTARRRRTRTSPPSQRTSGAGDGAPGQGDLRLGGGLGRRVSSPACTVSPPAPSSSEGHPTTTAAETPTVTMPATDPTPPAPAHGPEVNDGPWSAPIAAARPHPSSAPSPAPARRGAHRSVRPSGSSTGREWGCGGRGRVGPAATAGARRA